MLEQLSLPLEARPRTRAIPPRAIVVFSGGQDSTTCLYWAKSVGFNVIAITFDYNQRHRREIEAATRIAHHAGVAHHEVVELGPVLKGSSPLVSSAELEQYEHHSMLPGGLEKTFVPMRNQLFLTIAANRAYLYNAEVMVTGVSQEDYGGYPDCRDVFIKAFSHACNMGTFTGKDGAPRSLGILTPLMHLSKAESVRLALDIPGCYAALGFSHTAYDGVFPPTGHDHASLLRAKGFEEAGVPDPLVLRANAKGLMALPETENYSREMVAHVIEKFNLLDEWGL